MMQRILNWAEVVDAYRLVPRLLLVGYGWMLARVSLWFMALVEPSGPQAAFVATVWGAAVGITGFYVSTGRKWA